MLPILTLNAVGAAAENRGFVIGEPAAAIGEDGWPIDQARPILLAAARGEPPDAAALWKHGAADCRAALADRIRVAAGK